MLIRALLLVVGRSLRQHRVAGRITCLSISLAVALLMTVQSLQHQAARVFAGQTGGYDAVLGPRGSALQLVLCSLYHLENSPGTLPWELFRQIRSDPRVSAAVPIALGDNYLGFRLVATTADYFRCWGTGMRFAQGRPFEGEREAVVGSWAARQTGLAPGMRFHAYHGLDYDAASQEHDEEFVVVGVAEATNSPQDRAIWIPLDGFYRNGGHVLRGAGGEYVPRPGQAIPDEVRELSSVLVKFRSPQAGMALEQEYNREGRVATLAWPVARVVYELFQRLGWMMALLSWLCFLVLLVAAASITASLCNTLQERRREFAILRALGASRGFVAAAIMAESGWLAALGSFWGTWVYYFLMLITTTWLKAGTGLQLQPQAWFPGLLGTPLLVVALGFLSGLLPTWMAYRAQSNLELGPTS